MSQTPPEGAGEVDPLSNEAGRETDQEFNPEAFEEDSQKALDILGESLSVGGEELPRRSFRGPVEWEDPKSKKKRRNSSGGSASKNTSTNSSGSAEDDTEDSTENNGESGRDSGRDSGSGDTQTGESSNPPVKPLPKKKGTRHNWAQIATDFIEGIPKDGNTDERWFPNLRELAEHHGAGYQTVRARAGKERWADRKEQHALEVVRERQKARTKTLVSKSLDFDDRAIKVAELGFGLVMNRIAEIAQEITKRKPIRDQALDDLENGLAIDYKDLYSAVNYKELEGLSNAASRFQEIGRKALGTDVQHHEISGPGGEPIPVQAQMNVHAEIMRDDPDRIAAILSSLQDAGMLEDGIIDEVIGEEVTDEGE